MNKLLSSFEEHFTRYLTPAQWCTLSILIGLLNQYKQVKIERLATYFSLPILYESRRKHIQRFLKLATLSIPIIWFPLIKLIIQQEFTIDGLLIISLDRTQWKDKNLLMASVIWCNHALPIYWNVLEKKGASNLEEQKAVLKPVLRLFKNHQVVVIGDREFHSVELASWLEAKKKKRKKEIYYAFRQKEGTYFQKKRGKYKKLSEIEIVPGVKQLEMGIKITKKKGFDYKNLAVYKKRKHRGKSHNEPWYILTNLSNVEEVLKVYAQRTGIEAMFKDCKTGGYNLEGTKADTQRLTNLILLIAIAYTNRAIIGKMFKRKAKQKYIARPEEKRRKTRRHSEFWLGLYGELWCDNYEVYYEEVNQIMQLNKNKRTFYQKGLQAMSEIKKLY